MTLQTSGPISLSDLRGEFGGSAPDSLSEYYRGGGLVPDTAANSSIPTSGQISLSDFYGATNISDFTTTITIGTDVVQTQVIYGTYPPYGKYPIGTATWTGYGYDGGPDFYDHTPNYGSIGNDTYTDAVGQPRTIASCIGIRVTNTVDSSTQERMFFTLLGSNRPDSDNTFVSITVDGTTFIRTDAGYHNDTPSGNTTWEWSGQNPFGTGGSGTVNLTVDVTP